MMCANIMPKTKIEKQLSALVIKNNNKHWNNIRKNYLEEDLNIMINWIDKTKNNDNTMVQQTLNSINLAHLNKLQKLTYKIVNKFKEERQQLLMIMLGTAGTGKSFTVAAISELKKDKIKRSAFTAKAAFLIKGKYNHIDIYI
jgi:ATP-dependent Lon protease